MNFENHVSQGKAKLLLFKNLWPGRMPDWIVLKFILVLRWSAPWNSSVCVWIYGSPKDSIRSLHCTSVVYRLNKPRMTSSSSVPSDDQSHFNHIFSLATWTLPSFDYSWSWDTFWPLLSVILTIGDVEVGSKSMILTDISFERISGGKRSRFETESNRQYLPLSREVVLVQIFNQTVTITAKSHTKVRKWERKCMSRGHPQLKKRKRNYSNNSIIIDNYSLDSWELFCRYSPRLKRKNRKT